MPNLDLSQLTPPDIIEALDYEAILADCKAYLISIYPDAASMLELESEPLVKALEVQAYRELLLRARYNDEARALLLAFSTGTDLDHIGITYYDGEERLLVSAGDPDAIPPIEEVWELDDDYRQRLALKPESYSVAGPTGAFRFHALSAHGQVKSVGITSPIGGTTAVYVLSRTGNGTPSAEILTAVETRLNAEGIRPLSEEVLVSAAIVVEYSIDIDLYVFPGATSETLLAQAQTALEKYTAAYHAVEADIEPTAVSAAAFTAGVKRTVVNSPAAAIVNDETQAAYCTGITLRIAGVES